MQTKLQILSAEECHEVHERSLKVLDKAGVRVESARARVMLAQAGAEVDEEAHNVRFPRNLIDEALRIAPKQFSLGARRPEWDLEMNIGECSILPDGEATTTLDRWTGEQRPCTYQDWVEATIITDYLDEVGLFWSMVQSGKRSGSVPDMIAYWISVFRYFSKHVQIEVNFPEQAPWLHEILQTIFGDRESIRHEHPISLLICPQSPLIIDRQPIDAYLELQGLNIPVAAMPMPLMGGTAPGNMISTVIQGNCEILALLCLVQAVEPGAPLIYAPALARMNPRTGQYSGGAVENGLFGVAATEMGRYYGLPVEASGGGTDTFIPGIQASYERTITSLLATLAWPDILVGAGLLGNSMVLSLEQLLIDVEVFKMSAHTRRGILTGDEHYLDEVICKVGPGGNYLSQRSTVEALRSGEWFISELGVHKSKPGKSEDVKSALVKEVQEWVEEILAEYQPLPLGDEVERELAQIKGRARTNTSA